MQRKHIGDIYRFVQARAIGSTARALGECASRCHGRWGSVHLDSIGSHCVVLSFSPISNPCRTFFPSFMRNRKPFVWLLKRNIELFAPSFNPSPAACKIIPGFHVLLPNLFCFPNKEVEWKPPLIEVRTTMNH